jgi:ribosomal protein S18 acetylase RimI-like enzyme
MIRRATVDDADGIAEVQVKTWQVAYRGHMPDDFLNSLSVERRAAVWRQLARASNQAIFVAEDPEGAIVGFVGLCSSRDEDAQPSTGEIAAIYVLPDSWDRGQGKALMDAAIDEGRTRGYDQVTLWVLDGNQRARRFYETYGFKCDGSTKEDSRWGNFTIREVRYRWTASARSE